LLKDFIGLNNIIGLKNLNLLKNFYLLEDFYLPKEPYLLEVSLLYRKAGSLLSYSPGYHPGEVYISLLRPERA